LPHRCVEDLDDEVAADYYEKYILPEVESLLGSNDVRKQRQGMAILKQMKLSMAATLLKNPSRISQLLENTNINLTNKNKRSCV